MKSISPLRWKIVLGEFERIEELAKMVRRARRIAVEDWLLRHRGKPELPQQSAPTTRRKRRANKSDPMPDLGPPRPKTEPTKIYHAIVTQVPEMGTSVASCISKEVWSSLNAKIDWRRRNGEDTLRRRDAILGYEDCPPWARGLDVPIVNKHTKIEFGDQLFLVVEHLVRPNVPLRLELSLKGVPPKWKKLVRRVQEGELKHADSFITQRRGKWYLVWPIEQEPRVVLDEDVKCELFPNTKAPCSWHTERPFVVQRPSGQWWSVGDGRYLYSQVTRLIGLRKQVGYRYRHAIAKGHGRQKVTNALRCRIQQTDNIRSEFRHRAVRKIIEQCERNGAGLLVYHEPTGPAKEHCWFAKNDLEFDWTAFEVDLKNAASKRGIKVKKVKLKLESVLSAQAEAVA